MSYNILHNITPLLVPIACALFIFLICGLKAVRVVSNLKKARLSLQNRKKSIPELHKIIATLQIQLSCIVGVILATGCYLVGAVLGNGFVQYSLPLLVIGIIFIMSYFGYKKSQNNVPEDPVEKELNTFLQQVSYTEGSSFTEKNTLELQAFGNEMYMTSHDRIKGFHAGVLVEQYTFNLSDFFFGRSISFTFPQSFSSKIFIIKRDFAHSQLLLRSGVWQEVPLGEANFDATYALFTKEPEHAISTITKAFMQAICNLQSDTFTAQSFYFEDKTLYILLSLPENTHYSLEGQSSEAQLHLLRNDMHCLRTFLDAIR